MASPNVVLVLVEDMGFSDSGCYGGEVRTPNLDRLARGGVRFSQFYNTARCSLSRASPLTGLHPHQTDIGILTNDMRPRGCWGTINRRCVTIVEALKTAKQEIGYQEGAQVEAALAEERRSLNGPWCLEMRSEAPPLPHASACRASRVSLPLSMPPMPEGEHRHTRCLCHAERGAR
jgi:Sulfatase